MFYNVCSLQDNADTAEVITFFETYYSHIFYIVYDAFITAEINLRQRGAHKAQREELESVLYLFEKVRKKKGTCWETICCQIVDRQLAPSRLSPIASHFFFLKNIGVSTISRS